MDNVMSQLARELADAISAAVEEDPKVEACWEKARAAGYEMQVSLEAVVGFGSRSSQALAKVETPAAAEPPPQQAEITANDRRFLRSLRIAADEMGQQVE
ncbi:MAG: hypothetical protein OXQ28_08005 [Acidobacteriota bacterium]|nr:hypothetical protein [Acidobacteriota bacterium]